MSYSFTTSTSFTATRTVVEYVASKIAADLRILYNIYKEPSLDRIEQFYKELVVLLIGGYVEDVEYGFKRNGLRILSMKYEFRSDGTLRDSNAGGVPRGVNIVGASFYSHLMNNRAWDLLTGQQKLAVQNQLPIQRENGNSPSDGSGSWSSDRSYSMEFLGAQRRIFKSY